MSGPVKVDAIARAIVAARIAHPELVPFDSGDGADDDRGSYLNASEIGRCLRQVWYERSDTPREDDDARPSVFDRGHAAEAWPVAILGGAGIGKLLCAGDELRRLIDEKGRIAGTPDGLLVVHRSESAIEIKSYGSTVDRGVSPSTANMRQAAAVAAKAKAKPKLKLKRTMQRLDLAKARRPGYTVQLLEEPAPTVLDEAALASALGDLEAYRRRGDPVENLVVRGQ